METQDDPHLEAHDVRQDEPSILPHDSMVTVRLSEPPAVAVEALPLGTHSQQAAVEQEIIREHKAEEETIVVEEKSERMSDVAPGLHVRTSNLSAASLMSPEARDSGSYSMQLSEEPNEESSEDRRGSETSETTDEQVNWEELEKTEELQPRDQDSEDVSS